MPRAISTLGDRDSLAPGDGTPTPAGSLPPRPALGSWTRYNPPVQPPPSKTPHRKPRWALTLLAIALLGSGCQSSLEWLGMKLIFDPARWPADRIVKSPYGEEDPTRQRFALCLPEAATAARGRGEGWPTLVFVHGGGWTEGSIDLETGGQPIYGNIGGFYAGRGYGVALVEYRLQEEPTQEEPTQEEPAEEEPADDGSFSAPADEQIGWRDQVLRQLRNQGVLVLDVEAAELTPQLINRYLEIKARHLL